MAPSTSSSSGGRKASIAEVAEKTLDKNTIILIVNLVILVCLMSLLYMIASSALASTSGNVYPGGLPATGGAGIKTEN